MIDIKTKIESLLFVSAKALTAKQLASVLEIEEVEVKKIAIELADDLEKAKRGIILAETNGKYQLVSAPTSAEVVKKFLGDEAKSELSRPSLETLTIIAYRGPISKIELESIRGVNCVVILRNLLWRGLIEAEKDKAGQELYSVTTDFLRFLGVGKVSDLPDYENLKREVSALPKQVKDANQ